MKILSSWGQLDYLVCNAGGGTPGCDSDSESWNTLLKKILYHCNSVSVLRLLLNLSHPLFVFLLFVFVVVTDAPIGYSCSKAAINMFVRCKAVELSAWNESMQLSQEYSFPGLFEISVPKPDLQN